MGTKTFNNYESLLTFTRASKGHALRPVSYGTELVTNGTFDSDTTGWAAARCTAAVSSGQVVLTSTDTNPVFTQTLNLTIGKLYRVEGDIIGSTGTAVPQINMFDSGFSSYDNLSASGSFSFIPTTATNYLQLRVQGTTVGDTATFDNISVKEVTFDESDGTLTLFEHPDNIPRVEWDSAGNRLGLLVEESRTNLVTHSESFDNSEWTKVEGSITADAITAPDGTSTADFFVPSTNNANNHLVRDSINVSSAQHSWSVFAKAGGYNWIRLIHGDGDDVDHAAFFDISNGIVGAVSASATASIVDVGNGWYRCSVTVSAAASASSTQNQFIYVAEGDGDVTFAGDGTSGIYIWGAQLEAGSFPTSYIKTTGATATRSADVASIPTADFGFNQKEGTLLIEGEYKFNTSGSGYPRILELGNTTTSQNRIVIYMSEAGNDAVYGPLASNVQVASINLFADQTDGVFEASKMAIVFAENNFAGARDGVVRGTDTSGSIAPSEPRDILAIGRQGAGASSIGTGHFKTIKYYPRALTPAQLQALTEPRSTPTLSLTFDGLESSYTENYIHG